MLEWNLQGTTTLTDTFIYKIVATTICGKVYKKETVTLIR